MDAVYIGLGSNMGNRLEQLQKAVRSLRKIISNLRTAPVYETAPQLFEQQDYFLNTVVSGCTSMSPPQLLIELQAIEKTQGREREKSRRYGPRTIDLDILLSGKLCQTWNLDNNRTLTVPHERMHERLFVLQPLLDLNPQLTDPRDNVPWSDKAELLRGQEIHLFKNRECLL